MNKLLTTVALLSVIATPALAQSYDPDLGSGNIAPAYDTMTSQPSAKHVRHSPRDAFARVSPGATETGSLTSTDPDPNIRFQLNREAEEGQW
jgi:hypothetical protein